MSCSDDWYQSIYYGNNTFAVLQPLGAIECYQKDGGSTGGADKETIELGIMTSITMILGLFFLLYIMCQSCTRVGIDWYRLLAAYIIGTIGVPLSIAFGPKQGGFNRIVGFGILVHNLAELFIIDRVWLGARYCSAMAQILYVWVIMTLLVFVPMTPLFLILMLQGAFCDWTLVYTFFYLGKWMDKKNPSHREFMGLYGKLGTAAAVTHILSIQPLFLGFATTLSLLNGITVIFLMPTFILYIWFASADKNQRPVVITNSRTSQPVMDGKRNIMLRMISRKFTLNTNDDKNKKNDDDYNDDDDEKTGLMSKNIKQNIDDIGDDNDKILDSRNFVEAFFNKPGDNVDGSGDDEIEISYYEIVLFGLVNIDGSTWKAFKFITGAAALTTTINSLIIWLAPCYIDIGQILCGE